MSENQSHVLPADNRAALRQVARGCGKAALASLASDGGDPYVSLVTVALDHDMAALLLLSGLADHTRNLAADSRVSLLFDGTAGHDNPQAGPRLTLTGRAERSDDPRLKARFLARHPAAAMYAGFADFALWRVAPSRGHFVGGFGRAVWFDAPFGADMPLVGAVAAERAILERDDADAIAAAVAIIAGGAEAGSSWRLTAVDVDGAEVVSGQNCLRVAFRTPAATPAEMLARLMLCIGGNY